MKGMGYLVGAGPGDYRLITLKGIECLKRAEVVVYDRLADERILAWAPADAERIYVGKASSHHTMRQEDISALLAAKAQEGKTVVRLKGGDPFVFGRGGGSRGGDSPARARLGHGRLGQTARGVLRGIRLQADLRHRLPKRACRLCLVV